MIMSSLLFYVGEGDAKPKVELSVNRCIIDKLELHPAYRFMSFAFYDG